MKYQHFAIIFVIIILPISFVLSYYIKNQTDTLTLETQYQSKLNDSTYDAISAYQINSLNTQKVSGESVKSYVLASVNTFFTSLLTNLGMSSASRSTIQSYVPAILFTTYDGYYIYSPTKLSKVVNKVDDGTAVLTPEKEVVYEKNGNTETITEDEKNEISSENDYSNSKMTTDPNDAKQEYNYMLKPFIYYSARYSNTEGTNEYDFVASYALDNYLTLYGEKADAKRADNGVQGFTEEFSKSGYLIDPSKIELNGYLLLREATRTSDDDDGRTTTTPAQDSKPLYECVYETNSGESGYDVNTYNNVRYRLMPVNKPETYNVINYYQNDVQDAERKVFGKNSETFWVNNKKYYPTVNRNGNSLRLQTGDEIIEETLNIETLIGTRGDKGNILSVLTTATDTERNSIASDGPNEFIQVKYDGIEITDKQAKEYYIKAYFFSTWVQRNLSDVTIDRVKQDYYLDDDDDNDINAFSYINFAHDTNKVFDITNAQNNDPESDDSIYANHKRNVIRNSIQFNLNTAISTYNATYHPSGDVAYEYRLPTLKESDWSSILNNVCMVSFLQGMPCGLTTFNNYSVVKSNNNNTTVSLENIYFTDKIGKDQYEGKSYHKYDCPKLLEESTQEILEADQSAEFKYDAKQINLKVDSESRAICAYETTTNTYYKIGHINPESTWTNIDNIKVLYNEPIANITEYTNNEEEKGPLIPATAPINLTDLMNASTVIYVYDHQNTGCYSCIVSGIYTPLIKYVNGELYATYTDPETLQQILGEKIVNDTGTVSWNWRYPNGDAYDNTKVDTSKVISVDNFEKLEKSIYTAIGRLRNSIYKTNEYINR